MSEKKYVDVLEVIYADFNSKKNELKIKMDNLRSEIEVLTRSMEYHSKIEDDSRLFSPWVNDNNSIDTLEKMEEKKEALENLVEDTEEKYTYYLEKCKMIKPLLSEKKKKEDDEEVEEVIRDTEDGDKEEVVYNFSFNYDQDDMKQKLTGIINKLDVCSKIFDNDPERTKQEIKSIKKSIKQIIDSISY